MAGEPLQNAFAAHGGLDCWNCFEKVQATIITGGQLFEMKGTPQYPAPRRITVIVLLNLKFKEDEPWPKPIRRHPCG